MKELIKELREFSYDIPAANAKLKKAAYILEQLASGGVELPEPALYAHELIANKGGVWLGVAEKGICEQAHVDGETGDVIKHLFTQDQLIDYGNRRAAQAVLAERQKMVGDAVVMTIQADLIREVANALSVLIKAKPLTAAFDYGNDSIGNLRVRLHIESSSHRSTLKDVMEQAGISTERINGYFKGEQA